LHWATLRLWTEGVRLLEAGAHPCARDAWERTPGDLILAKTVSHRHRASAEAACPSATVPSIGDVKDYSEIPNIKKLVTAIRVWEAL